MSVPIYRSRPYQLPQLRRRQIYRNFLRDVSRRAIFEGEQVAYRPVVALRPKVLVCRRSNQLGSYSHAFPYAFDPALDQCFDVAISRQLIHVNSVILKGTQKECDWKRESIARIWPVPYIAPPKHG